MMSHGLLHTFFLEILSEWWNGWQRARVLAKQSSLRDPLDPPADRRYLARFTRLIWNGSLTCSREIATRIFR